MGQPLSPSLVRENATRLPTGLPVVIVVAALTAQVYLPLYVRTLGFFDLPLLIVAYLALLGRRPIVGLLIGAAVGLAQDGLTHGPVGVFGMTKTIVGYLAGWVSQVIEVGFPGARSVLVAIFFLLHQFLFWTVQTVLLGNELAVDLPRALGLAAAHAGAALLLYRLLDRWKKTS